MNIEICRATDVEDGYLWRLRDNGLTVEKSGVFIGHAEAARVAVLRASAQALEVSDGPNVVSSNA